MATRSEKAVSLATMQSQVESAAREYKLASNALRKAIDRASNAEKAYENAIAALNQSVSAFKMQTKVKSIHLD